MSRYCENCESGNLALVHLGSGHFRKQCRACGSTGPFTPERPEWRGVYPGMCIDPNVCRGYSHCPRDYSCCE